MFSKKKAFLTPLGVLLTSNAPQILKKASKPVVSTIHHPISSLIFKISPCWAFLLLYKDKMGKKRILNVRDRKIHENRKNKWKINTYKCRKSARVYLNIFRFVSSYHVVVVVDVVKRQKNMKNKGRREINVHFSLADTHTTYDNNPLLFFSASFIFLHIYFNDTDPHTHMCIRLRKILFA